MTARSNRSSKRRAVWEPPYDAERIAEFRLAATFERLNDPHLITYRVAVETVRLTSTEILDLVEMMWNTPLRQSKPGGENGYEDVRAKLAGTAEHFHGMAAMCELAALAIKWGISNVPEKRLRGGRGFREPVASVPDAECRRGGQGKKAG